MKKIILGALLLLSTLTFGQKDTLKIKDFYVDLPSLLVKEKVISVDSLTTTQLINKFENWGGKVFRNYNEVRTSKTENQITLSYIKSIPDGIDMYIIMQVEFKDGKARIRLYDDGNVFRPGSYGTTYSVPSVAARTYYIKSYFIDGDKDQFIYKNKSGFLNIKYKQAQYLLGYISSIDLELKDIEEFLKKKDTTSKSKDW
jgi:hypothetical protein